MEPGSQPPASKPNKRAGSNAPTSFDVHGELYRISGTDLTQIDGINIMTAQTIIAEVGVDMSRFTSEAHTSLPSLACVRTTRLLAVKSSAGAPDMSRTCRHRLTYGRFHSVAQQDLPGSKVPPLASTTRFTQGHHGYGPRASPTRLPHA